MIYDSGFKNKYDAGQAMIVATIFFLLVSITIIFGLIGPIARQQKITSNLLLSRQSLFLAEAGVEDVVYRLDRGLSVGATEELNLNGSTASTVTTDTADGKKVSSTGVVSETTRKMEANLVFGEGVAFHYGIQVGAGGLNMNNGVEIAGSVYSNGNIEGDNGVTISGDAYAVGEIDDVEVSGASVEGADPKDFPISLEIVNKWKNDATLGGVINGNYNVSSNVSLGPKEITGNLSLTSNNKTLTVTGAIYVRGNINISNGSSIKCHASFGQNSCIIVADGWIHSSNNGNFSGSGISGSYLLMFATLACDGSSPNASDGKPCTHHNSAIDMHNVAVGVIFYAPNGKINLHQNVDLTAATAYRLDIDNNSTVNYEIGLADVIFTSGPSGGYDIDTWKEIE